ncbi:MAG TPA: hypothetical protein VGC25_06965 [Alphaproteobacteria bacterium]|jgi:hypothetical protein
MAAEGNARRPARSEVHRRQREKNIALLVVLATLAALFYVITIVKMGGAG